MSKKRFSRQVLMLLLVLVLLSQTIAVAVPADATGEIVATERFGVPASPQAENSDSDGDYSHRSWEPDYCERELAAQEFAMARVRSAGRPQLFGATRSAGVPGEATVGNMSIESVEVLFGGSYQARYRGQVGHGPTVAQGASGNYYTTAIAASLTDPRMFTIHTDVPAALVGDPSTFLSRVTYTYGDLEFEAWLGGGNTFVGGASGDVHFISLYEHSLINNLNGTFTLESRVRFYSPYAGAPAVNRGINQPFEGYRGMGQAGFPLAMRHVVGTFDLDIQVEPPAGGADAMIGSMPIRLNLYDDFFLWYEIEEWALDLYAEAGAGRSINDRYVGVNIIGYSHQGRPIYNIVVAESQAAVDHYLNVTLPLKLEDPQALRERIQDGERHLLPIYIHNIHPDEVSGVCSQLIMVEQLIRDEFLVYETIDISDTIEVITNPAANNNTANRIERTSANTTAVTIPVEEALEHFIFVFTPTNNPDGRYMLRRANAYGFDLNRDAAFQTQPENRYVMQNVIEWAPAIMLEFHGHVAGLLIEPCTPPHNPNYEYDLMQPMMLRLAHEMGRAAISGAYYRYMIPFEHRQQGWDDGAVVYFPMYAALFGVLGYTLEIPHANQDSFYANIAMGWATVNYSIGNFEELFFNKLEQHYRGINNIDARDEVDPFFVNPFVAAPNNVIGRPRLQLGQDLYRDFFPDYWVIPVDAVNQRNLMEAYNMVEKLMRQSIRVERLTTIVAHDGVIYPAGTFIINMRQTFRGAANAVLGTPPDISFFDSIYAEVTIDFPNLRGFSAKSIWEPELFDGLTQPIADFALPTTLLAAGASPYVVISNNNQDAIRVVNDLLREGADIWMLTSRVQGGKLGDFVTARANLTPAILAGRFVETTPLAAVPTGAGGPLLQPRAAVLHGGLGAGQGIHPTARFILADLGFDYVWAQSNAELAALDPASYNILVSHNVNWANMLTIANSGVPIVAVQQTAAAAVDSLFSTPVTANNLTASREGVFRGSYSTSSMLTGHFGNHDTVYMIGARTYSVIPDGTTPLIRTASGTFESVFLGGWFQNNPAAANNQLNAINRITAYTGVTAVGVPATVFGTNIFNRAHTQVYHNILATALFMHVAGINEPAAGRPFARASVVGPAADSTVTMLYFATEVAGQALTVTEQWFNVSTSPTVPSFNSATTAADGWLVYTAPFNIDITTKYVHWFAENSAGITHQGTFNFGVLPIFSFDIFNNGYGGTPSTPNASLAQGGMIRMWTQLDGVAIPVPYAELEVTAVFPNGECAMSFVNVNNMWENPGNVNLIDVNKRPAEWERIYLTVSLFDQALEIILVNAEYTPFVPPVFTLDIFNNGDGGTASRSNASLAQAGTIRIWTQLDGVNAAVPYAEMEVTAEFPNGDCAMAFVRINNMWANPGNVNLIDVNKRPAEWERIYLTATLFGQTIEVILVNAEYVPFVPPVFSLNIFNNGNGGTASRPNASLAQLGTIRMWTQLDGVNDLVPYAELEVSAVFPNGECAMAFVRVNNMWANLGNVNLIDVSMRPAVWERIYLTATLFGQTLDIILVNAE